MGIEPASTREASSRMVIEPAPTREASSWMGVEPAPTRQATARVLAHGHCGGVDETGVLAWARSVRKERVKLPAAMGLSE
jgi:hypothetical protein